MMQCYRARLLMVSMFFLCAGDFVTAQEKEKAKPFAAFERFYQKRLNDERIEFDPSKKTNSVLYYDSIAMQMAFPNQQLPQKLDDLLALFDAGLKADAIEGKRTQEIPGDEIVTARYFSPKTTDVSGREDPQLLSWRQVIRIKAKSSSVALKMGLKEVWWLTNVYAQSATAPFSHESQNNQVILVPNKPVPLEYPVFEGGGKTEHRLLFAVYGPKSSGYKLAHSTETSWDAGTVNLEKPKEPKIPYFTPASCIQCHGETYPTARLNFLDTDYYLWRTKDQSDFPGLKNVNWATNENGFAFESFHKLNNSIESQNKEVDGGKASFQTKSVEGWLSAHDKSLTEVAPENRGWNGKSPKLVGLLVKYCYRCHSTVAYSVLDRDLVLDEINSGNMARIGSDMPQDRVLDGPLAKDEVNRDLKTLMELLEAEK